MVLYIHDATVTCVNQTPLKVAMGFSCTVCTPLYVIHNYIVRWGGPYIHLRIRFGKFHCLCVPVNVCTLSMLILDRPSMTDNGSWCVCKNV